jgi:hypothetical protein
MTAFHCKLLHDHIYSNHDTNLFAASKCERGSFVESSVILLQPA